MGRKFKCTSCGGDLKVTFTHTWASERMIREDGSLEEGHAEPTDDGLMDVQVECVNGYHLTGYVATGNEDFPLMEASSKLENFQGNAGLQLVYEDGRRVLDDLYNTQSSIGERLDGEINEYLRKQEGEEEED